MILTRFRHHKDWDPVLGAHGCSQHMDVFWWNWPSNGLTFVVWLLFILVETFRSLCELQKGNDSELYLHFVLTYETVNMPRKNSSVKAWSSKHAPHVLILPHLSCAGSSIKSAHPGTSRVVQWLGLHLPAQVVQVQSLVEEWRSHMPPGQKKPNRSTL